jgi:8-oxo-dGTP pyrophosphatase MutT (NUDIX family)
MVDPNNSRRKIFFWDVHNTGKNEDCQDQFSPAGLFCNVCYDKFSGGPHRRGQEYFLRRRMNKLHTYVNAKIVFRVGSELLMFRAHDGHHYLPGGHLEYGEHPLAALQRELLEEMGYTLPAEPIALGAWTHVNDDEGTHRITVGYLLDLPSKPNFQWIATESSEGFEEYVWVPATRIDDFAMNPRFRKLLTLAAKTSSK